MGSQEHLPLCWNGHQAEVLATFQQHLSEETLVDVTLVCEGISLKAHKMILSACSTYFQNLFLENPCKHPIIIIKDADYRVVKGIVDFMYHGGINVSPDQLSEFLKTAESFKVKGLSDIRKSVELNSNARASSHQDHHSVVNSTQSLTSEHTENMTQSPMCRRQQQSNEDSENEEQYVADESNSFTVVEVKSEPESNEDISICYEQTVLPDYPSSDVNHSPNHYTVSMPPSTESETNYNHSVHNEQCVEVTPESQLDIVMKETPPQFSDVSTQNSSFSLMQSTSEDPMTTHLSSNQYSSSSMPQYIPVHDSSPATSKNQDIKSNSIQVSFEEPMFHSSNQMCENYSSRNPIIDGITGILEQKSCVLDKSIDIKPVMLKTYEQSSDFPSSSNLINQKFTATNPSTSLSSKSSFELNKETDITKVLHYDGCSGRRQTKLSGCEIHSPEETSLHKKRKIVGRKKTCLYCRQKKVKTVSQRAVQSTWECSSCIVCLCEKCFVPYHQENFGKRFVVRKVLEYL